MEVIPHKNYTWRQEETRIIDLATRGPMQDSPISRIKCTFLYVSVVREVVSTFSVDIPIHNFASHSAANLLSIKWETLSEFAQSYTSDPNLASSDTKYIMEEISWFITPANIPAPNSRYEIQTWTPRGTYSIPSCLPLLDDLNEMFILMREDVPFAKSALKKSAGKKTKRVHFTAKQTRRHNPSIQREPI